METYRALGDTRIRYTNPRSVVTIHTDDAAPRNPYATGYGSRIPTRHRIRFTDGRTRRVYVACYGNSGSAYVVIDGEAHYLDAETEYRIGA